MPHRQECPKCKAKLRISDRVVAPWVLCPRCLAPLLNPGAAAGKRICAYCAEEMSAAAKRCPHCQEPTALVHEQAERDLSRVRFGQIAIGLLGTAGILLYLKGVKVGSVHMPGWLIELVVALFLCTVLTLGSRSASRLGIGRFILGGLVTFAVTALAAFGFILAVTIYAFFTCKFS